MGFLARRAIDEVGGANAGPILERFGLAALADEDPFRLSTGEQRRLSLAATAQHRPALLLLDEPDVRPGRAGSRRRGAAAG